MIVDSNDFRFEWHKLKLLRDEVADLEARLRSANEAVCSAADTARQALDKIVLMTPVVDAARELCLANAHASLGVFGAADRAARAMQRLDQMVDAYNALADRKAGS